MSLICTFVLPQEENKCPGAEENGVSILHGNALAFVKVFLSNFVCVCGSNLDDNPMCG